MVYLDEDRVQLKFDMPLGELIVDFYDQLKSRTQGYASLDYTFKRDARRRPGQTRRAGQRRSRSMRSRSSPTATTPTPRGRELVQNLRSLIPRQMFDVPVQASIGSRIIARETIRAMRKNVLSKCYGGDITRKRKLLEKQKEGKARMKMVGSVEIPQEAFMAVLSLGSDKAADSKSMTGACHATYRHRRPRSRRPRARAPWRSSARSTRAERIILRTAIHPGMDDLARGPASDRLRRSVRDRGSVSTRSTRRSSIASSMRRSLGRRRLRRSGSSRRIGERTVPLIADTARAEQAYASRFWPAVERPRRDRRTSLGLDPASAEASDRRRRASSPRRSTQNPSPPAACASIRRGPLLVAQVYHADLAVAVKLALARVYPDDHEVSVVDAAGVA